MKERDTVILSIRVKKSLIPKIAEAIRKSRQPTRNSWLNWAIDNGLRSHRGK